MIAPTAPATRVAISVAVPVYNNTDSLRMLHERLVTTLCTMGSTYEIVYVNDGSTDASYDVLTGLRSGQGRVKILDLTRNYGQNTAILAAISEAVGDTVVTIDADLQNHPEDIPAMVREVWRGADLVCGVRRGRKEPLLFRRGSSWFGNWLASATLGIHLADWGCGLNAVRGSLVREILAQHPFSRMLKVDAALLASSIVQVSVNHSKRKHGKSGYNLWRLCCVCMNFLRSFPIKRNFFLMLNPPVRGDDPTPTGSTDGCRDSGRMRFSPITAMSWAVLAGVAGIVQAVLILRSSVTVKVPYKIREIIG